MRWRKIFTLPIIAKIRRISTFLIVLYVLNGLNVQALQPPFHSTDPAQEDINNVIYQKMSNHLHDGNGSQLLGVTPVGGVEMFASTTPPTGWLICDGTSNSTTTFSALFGVIGYSYGGSGANFSLPDFRGVFPKGAGTTTRGAGVDASGNAYAGTLGAYTQDKMQGHLHSVDPPNTTSSGQSATHTHVSGPAGNYVLNPGTTYVNSGGSSGGVALDMVNINTGNASGDHTHNVDIAAFDSAVPKTDGTNGAPRTGHTTEPQNIGINFIIFAGQ